MRPNKISVVVVVALLLSVIISQACVAGVSPKLLVTNESTLIIFDTRLGGKKMLSLGGLIRSVDFDYLSNTVFCLDSASHTINS